MLGGGLHGGNNAVVVVLGIGVHLGEPNYLLGVDGLPVHHRRNLAVRTAGVEADAAAVHVAANGLGIVLGLGDLVAEHHLKGMFKDVCHVVKVEILNASGGKVLPEIPGYSFLPGYVDLKATLHPQDGLDQAVDIVPVGRLHFRGAVNKGAADRHLAAGALHGDVHRLFRGGKKGAVKL